ncbi:MAG: hypothetical protein ACHQAY_08375 [Hyphomicrobiales bacterium]
MALIVGVDVYLLARITNWNRASFETVRLTNATSTESWSTYDGGTWSIKHPSFLIPTNKNVGTSAWLNLISFGGFADGSTVTVHTSNILEDPLGVLVLQRDPHRLEILSTVLELQKQALQGLSKQKLVAIRKLIINDSIAAEIIEVDSSVPADITYSAQTTFIKADSIAFVNLFTSRSPQPTAQTEQIYDAMLGSFQFK